MCMCTYAHMCICIPNASSSPSFSLSFFFSFPGVNERYIWTKRVGHDVEFKEQCPCHGECTYEMSHSDES